MRVEQKARIAGDGKAVHGKRVERLVRLDEGRRRAHRAELREAVRDEEDEDDELAVCRALDLEIAEERVGAEEVEGLVDDVGLRGIGHWSRVLAR